MNRERYKHNNESSLYGMIGYLEMLHARDIEWRIITAVLFNNSIVHCINICS